MQVFAVLKWHGDESDKNTNRISAFFLYPSLQKGSSKSHAPKPQWHRWKGAASCHASVGPTHRYRLHPLLHHPQGSRLQLVSSSTL